MSINNHCFFIVSKMMGACGLCLSFSNAVPIVRALTWMCACLFLGPRSFQPSIQDR